MGLVQGRSQYNWENGIPCRNPHCKSNGRPHPNCMCGLGGPQSAPLGAGPAGPSKAVTSTYAEGGDVEENQCSGVHKPECEYYAGDPDLGKTVLKNAIARHTSEDDVTNTMLGKSQPENALHALAVTVGASGLLGKIGDSLLGGPKKTSSLNDLANKQLSKKAQKFLNQMSMIPPDEAMNPEFIKDVIRPEVKKMIGQNNPHVIDAVVTAISRGETDQLSSIIGHAKQVSRGHKSIDDSIESLFSGGDIDQDPSDDDREKLKEFIKQGGINAQLMKQVQEPQMMAGGGDVNVSSQQSPVQKAFPEQSMLVGMAKSSVNNYLQQKQPQPDSKLPFDSHYKNSHKEREYNRALDIANKPLSVMKHMQQGTLLPEHVQHLSGMYPDLYNHLGKKTTERIVKAQMSGENPSYRLKQGLSMFLGTPLDSTMTPQAIQSVQAIYAPRPMPQQGGSGKAPKNTSKIGKIAEDHYTGDQAAEKRQTAWD